jgi:CRP-like cAMP-binding protein
LKRADVLERKVIHTGKVFITEGEDNKCAYLIQAGKVRSFVTRNEEKIEVEEYGPGTIIGEVCLVIDEPSKMSFEAVTDTTVVTITRQDFDNRLMRVDSGVKNILNQIVSKLYKQEDGSIEDALENAELDDDAIKIVQALINDLPTDKRYLYEKAILPHLNGLIKAIKKIKDAQRHEEQKAVVDKKVKKIKDQEE